MNLTPRDTSHSRAAPDHTGHATQATSPVKTWFVPFLGPTQQAMHKCRNNVYKFFMLFTQSLCLLNWLASKISLSTSFSKKEVFFLQPTMN